MKAQIETRALSADDLLARGAILVKRIEEANRKAVDDPKQIDEAARMTAELGILVTATGDVRAWFQPRAVKEWRRAVGRRAEDVGSGNRGALEDLQAGKRLGRVWRRWGFRGAHHGKFAHHDRRYRRRASIRSATASGT